MGEDLYIGFCASCNKQTVGKAYLDKDGKNVCAKCAGVKSRDILILEALQALLRLQISTLSEDLKKARKEFSEAVGALRKDVDGE